MAAAAVLPALNEPLIIRNDVEIEPPRAGEVQVRVTAAGVCHSDLSFQDGTIPTCLPVVLGHEGTGVVEAVGAEVDGLSTGDRVIFSWVPQCGRCWFCVRRQPHLCRTAEVVMVSGGLLDGTPRLRLDGQPLFQMLGTGTFAERSVLAASALVRAPDDLDPPLAALLGCGVLTGVGAALNTAAISEGDSVAVLGCGGTGLSVVQGARIAGAGAVIAVDVNRDKLELAERLGATDVVDASRRDAVSAVMGLTGERGADVAFEVVGTEATIERAISMTRRGGQAVLVGIPPLGATVGVPAMQAVILQARTIKGCWYGSADVRRDIPRLVELHQQGLLQLEPLISGRLGLEDVNRALESLRAGQATRTVILN